MGISEKATTAEEVLSVAAKLGRTLHDAPAFRQFVTAQREADSSESVRRARRQLLEARVQVQQAMQNLGDVSSAVNRFHAAQAELQSLPEVKKLFASQQELIVLFEFLATQITEASGVDFVEACRGSGGCCG